LKIASKLGKPLNIEKIELFENEMKNYFRNYYDNDYDLSL